MINDFVGNFRRFEDKFVSCYQEVEAMKILCKETAKLFGAEAMVNVVGCDINLLCETHFEKKPFFSVTFKIGKDKARKYKYEVFFDKKRLNQISENDFRIFSRIIGIIKDKYKDDAVSILKSSNYRSCFGYSHKTKEEEKVSFKQIYEKNKLYDMMAFKVKEILLVASLYDAFTIESEGNLTQKVLGEFARLNLSTFPRITAVTYNDDVLESLCKKHFDLIIVIVGNDKKKPINIIKNIKKNFEYLPVYMLLNNNAVVSDFVEYKLNGVIDNLFVWNGDSRIFFSMIKLLEDRVNLKEDVKKVDGARIILLVEDTTRFYSRYLPELYMIVFEQTRRVMESVAQTDELSKVLSIRLRPKILLESSYEGAIEIFNKYRNNILSVITDVEYYRNGVKDQDAGIDLARYIKKETPEIDLPVIIQSRNPANKKRADEVKCTFIYKESDTLAHDIRHVIKYNMGFGDFVYRNKKGEELGYRAKTLDDFEKYLKILPADSLKYHALRNHFSLWLWARGEFTIADMLSHLTMDDFKDIEHMRKFLIQNLKLNRFSRTKGQVVEFSEAELKNPGSIVALSSGAIGGKGRGIVFINKLINGMQIIKDYDNLAVRTPATFIIGTDTYDEFIENNNLREFSFDSHFDFDKLKQKFLSANFSIELIEKLRKIVEISTKPLAVRSSGLFEDSLMQPFAGIFETYIIPNNHQDIEIRLKQLTDAVKLVYVSVFSPMARDYIEAIDYKVEEEKMAVVIQEVVGNEYGGYYYPHISGTAQSYNYYPFSYIKPEDGLATIALGLGSYVVEGGRSYHFSPKYPKLQNNTLKDIVANSQTYFLAVDLKKTQLDLSEGENAALKKLDLWDAEKHGTLKHLASVYDAQNNILSAGIDKQGPRVLNFANILKFNYIPLADVLVRLLDIMKEAMGAPVEIEFAIDLNKDTEGKAYFYLLQVKPMIGESQNYVIDVENLEKEKLLFFTDNAMGNGIYKNIADVVYVVPERFNKSRTEEIANEIEAINKKMVKAGKKYVLIVPGRLGTRDKWIGIPVTWTQISNAKVIIETSLPNFPLDASAGSHFFHNVIAMNVGYFSVQYNNDEHFIRWEMLDNQEIVDERNFVRHIRFDKNFIIKMDGKKRVALIELQNEKIKN